MINGKWEISDTNRRARYYRLTAAGRKHLVAETVETGADGSRDRTGDATCVILPCPAGCAEAMMAWIIEAY